jgi:hypothetical protein
MELFLNISNLALILKAKFKKLFFEEISLKNLRKKDFQFGLNIKSQFFKLKKYWTVFKHFQFGPNIKSQI